MQKTPSPNELRLAHLLLFVTPAFWAVNYLVARWAPGSIAPHALALGRWTIATAVLALFCRAELQAKRDRIAPEAWHFLVLGALGMWICGAFVYIGGRSTSAVNIGLLYGAAPVLIALASAAWLDERLEPVQVFGATLALAGMVHILVRGDWTALLAFRFNPGDLWVAVAVIAWAAYSILLRRWTSAFGPLARLTLIAAGGIVVLVPFTIIEAATWLPTEISWRSAGLVLAAALLPGIAAYGSYSVMQRTLGAAKVGLVLYLGPLYSAALAAGVLGERIDVFHVVGAVLILPGMWLATRRA